MPVTSQQFGRVVQVEVVPANADGIIVNPNPPPAPQLRVKATVTKSMGGTPARAVIDVTNLGRTEREKAAGIIRRVVDFSDQVGVLDGRVVFGDEFDGGQAERTARANGFGFLRLSAYYSGSVSGPAVIFEGTARSVDPVPGTKPSPVTRIVGGDGVIQEASAITDRQWSSTVSSATVLEYVIREVMGTRLAGSVAGNFAAGLPAKVRDLSLVGGYDATNLYATDILDQFARVTDTEWWWDDGTVYWLARGTALPAPPVLVSVTPAPGAFVAVDAPQAVEDDQVSIPLLLLPEMRPGRRVTVIGSEEFGGDYICRSVQHAVDNRGGLARTTARLGRFGVLPFLD